MTERAETHCGSSTPGARSVFAKLSTQTLYILVTLTAVVPYLNTLLNGFVYDDNTQVMNNPYIQSFGHIKEIFSTTVWSYVGAQGLSNYYRPMMTFGYLICFQLFGKVAYGFHLANVLIHAAVVCILFSVTLELFHDRLWAFITAVLFAVHPIHSESVAWIAAVTDLELTFFYLITFWFFLRAAKPQGGRSPRALLGLAASFLLALLSKEQALTLPVLATIFEHGYRDDRRTTTWLQKLGRYYVLWLMTAAYMLFRIKFLGALAPVIQLSSLSWCYAFLSALALVGQYMWKLIWPVQLCAFYVFTKSVTPLDPRVMMGLAGLTLCAAMFFGLWRRSQTVSFAFLWFFATLGPVLNARWMAANVFAERYLYLPSVGFCWLAGWAAVELWSRVENRRKSRWALLAAGFALSGLACTRVVIRNFDWKDDIVLYTRTLEVSPRAYNIRNNLGGAYWNRGQQGEAVREWKEALRIAPTNVIILNNLGLAARRAKHYSEAVDYFERAIRIKPLYSDPHLNLGVAYQEMGELDKAAAELETAVTVSPLNVQAQNELGKLYMQENHLAEAERRFRSSVESEPNIDGWDGLGDVYKKMDDPKRAEDAFRHAVDVDPYDSHARFGLGALLEARGDRAGALIQYQKGQTSDPVNPEALAAIKRIQAAEKSK
jgi:protein O-mannosyl-transferase